MATPALSRPQAGAYRPSARTRLRFELWDRSKPVRVVRADAVTVVTMVAGVVAVVAGAWAGLPPMMTVGRVPLGWALLPGAALLVIALRRRDRALRSRAATVTLLAATVAAIVAFVAGGGAVRDVIGLAGVAVLEEAVFRVAIVALCIEGLHRAGVRRRRGFVIGVAVSSALFASMPGHVAQGGGLRTWTVCAAFGMVLCVLTWRTGRLGSAVLTHFAYDVLTVGLALGYGPSWWRDAGVLVVFAAALWPYHQALHTTVIDLVDKERRAASAATPTG